jgi:large subunit ribosomal protein L1
MDNHGKKYRKAVEKLEGLGRNKTFTPQEGIAKVKELAYARFDETVRADVNLGIDPQKGDQAVRGSVLLPHGIGKKVKVLVFAKGDYADAARKAGADYVGVEEFIEKIESGWLDFNYAVATPDLMGLVGKTAKILGPRGLLPNKKSGTVTFDVASVVSDLKKGRLFFKNDKSGIVHFAFGKVSFPVDQLRENLQAFIKALASARPPTAKGIFIKKVTISSTMGVGLPIATDALL